MIRVASTMMRPMISSKLVPLTNVRAFATLLDRAMSLRKNAIQRELNQTNQKKTMTADDQAMAVFDEIDLNGDGVLSREEFLIAVEKMRHLDLLKMKDSLACNDISFNHKASVLGRTVLITDEFDAWDFMKSLPEYKHVAHLCPPVALPPKHPDAPQYTLVLDMDETLLHCSVEEPSDSLDYPPDHEFKVSFQGSNYFVFAWLRPGLQDFLDKICGQFEVVIFTASQAAYANKILDIVDPENKYFQHRLFRDSCVEVDGNLMKDLNILGRDLSEVVIVDNSPHVFGFQVDNGIPIDNWYNDKTDNELQKLEWFLRQLDGDVRGHIRDKFQVHKLIEDAEVAAA